MDRQKTKDQRQVIDAHLYERRNVMSPIYTKNGERRSDDDDACFDKRIPDDRDIL